MKFIDKLKKIYQSNYFELSTIFLITFLITFKFSLLTGDEVWIYGFSYNIAKGLIPYRDFNMIVTPLYPLLQGLILFIFGKNIIIYHLFNAIICTGIFYELKRLYSKVYYIIYLLLLGFTFQYSNLLPGYNLFILFLLLLILYLEQKDKVNDFLIGLLLGLIFITKQNMGILLFLPTLTLFNWKKITKRIFGFAIPIFLLILYLLFTNSFLEFIDYTVLGLFDFKQNLVFDFSIILFAISFIYCIYQIFFKKNRDIAIKYFLCFLMMAYPLFDFNHIIFPFAIILAYFLNQFNHTSSVYRIFFHLFYLILIIYSLLFSNNVTIKERTFKGRVTYKDTYEYIKRTSLKLNNYFYNDSIDKLYFLADYAYLFKLHNGIELNKYDLINEGNMGYKGSFKYIDEISKTCLDKKCVFIIDKHRKNQIAVNILEYVENNYTYVEKFENFLVYGNNI